MTKGGVCLFSHIASSIENKSLPEPVILKKKKRND
jgi:hypothetical protein